MGQIETVKPGNIHDELIDDLLERNPTFIQELVECVTGPIKMHGAQVPVSVNGRDVKMNPHLMSTGDAKDIDGFYLLVQEVIADRLARENIAAEHRPIFTEENPPTDARSEVITFKLLSRCPGVISQGKQLAPGRQEWKGRHRDIMPDPDHPNKKLHIYSQVFDNVIELCCWAKTNKVANARALWLERLIADYTWYFKLSGVAQVRFHERTADMHEANDTDGNKIFSRPLKFYVRTERISNVSEYVLGDILLKTTVAADIR